MKRDSPKARYVVIDPNGPHGTQKLLKMMIVEKLLTGRAENPPRKSGQ